MTTSSATPGDDQDEPEPFDSDGMLSLFTLIMEKSGSTDPSMTITLNTAAGLVAGEMITFAQWRDALVGQIQDASEFMGEIVDGVLQPDPDDNSVPFPFQFVHLRNAAYYVAGQRVDVPLWRGRLSQVVGWHLGAHSS